MPARVKLGSLVPCAADDDGVEARPMVIVIEDDEDDEEDDDDDSDDDDTSESESLSSEEEKGAEDVEKEVHAPEEKGMHEKTESAREKLLKESANCDRDYFFARIMDVYVQTDDVIIQQIGDESLKRMNSIADLPTQTDCPDVKDRATSPVLIDTADGQMTTSKEDNDTMTDAPAVTIRQTQTDSLATSEQHQQTADVKSSTTDQFTNTQTSKTTERAMITERLEVSRKKTDTSGLIKVCEQATCTVGVTCPSVGVATNGTDNEVTKPVTCSVVTQTSLSLVDDAVLPKTMICNNGPNPALNTINHAITHAIADSDIQLGTSKADQPRIVTADVACCTEPVKPELAERPLMVTQATSMHRRVTALDQASCTTTTTTADEETSMNIKASVDAATSARAETADFGMLKRPRSISRGTGAQPVRTTNKSITTKMYDSAETPTNTPLQHFTDVSSGTPEVTVRSRECSPLGVPVADRASSPFVSTTATQDNPTSSRPERLYVDRAASPIRFAPRVREFGTCMGSVDYVDRASSPVLTPMRDSESMTERLATASVATATRQVSLADSGTQMKHIHTSCSGTSMPRVSYIDKETATRHVLFVNKNISTENITTADKQTLTSVDITAAYRSSIVRNKCRITRGTCTPLVVMATRHTSPPPATPMVHRASSPVLLPRCDKAVSVTQGEIREPVDLFQTIGRPSLSLKQLPDVPTSPLPRLPSIDEDTHETCDDDDGQHTTRPPPPSPTYSPCFSPNSPRFSPSAETRFSFHERLFTASYDRTDRGDLKRSTFIGGASSNGVAGGGASSILCTVESGTNTNGVETHTKGTCTPPPAETEDKAMCTEAVAVNGKMAECINKLKTVRHRLEQQQMQPPTMQPPTMAINAAIMSDGHYDSCKSGAAQVDADTSAAIDALSAAAKVAELSGRQLHRSLARKKRLGLADLMQTPSSPDVTSPPPLSPPVKSPNHGVARGTCGTGVGDKRVSTTACSAEATRGTVGRETSTFVDGSTNTDISLSTSSSDAEFRYLVSPSRRASSVRQEPSEDQSPAENGRRPKLRIADPERKSTLEQLRSMMTDRRKSDAESVGGLASSGKGFTPPTTVSPSVHMSDTARKRLEQRCRGMSTNRSLVPPPLAQVKDAAVLSSSDISPRVSREGNQTVQNQLEPKQTKRR